jgi:transcriptional regulator with XRE-family HTH domain
MKDHAMSKRMRHETVPYAAVRDEVLAEVPGAAEAWTGHESGRDFGLLFARMRKQAGLLQKDVAERTGWDKAFVSRLESGQGAVPDVQTLARFAEACGATAGVVFGREAEGAIHIIDAMAMPGSRTNAGQVVFDQFRDRKLRLPPRKGEATAW